MGKFYALHENIQEWEVREFNSADDYAAEKFVVVATHPSYYAAMLDLTKREREAEKEK